MELATYHFRVHPAYFAYHHWLYTRITITELIKILFICLMTDLMGFITPGYNLPSYSNKLINSLPSLINNITFRGVFVFSNNLQKIDNTFTWDFRLLGLVMPVFRLILSIIFVGSFLLRPLIMRPISLVWERIIDNEKPVFTLIFGFAGALAKMISEVAGHL